MELHSAARCLGNDSPEHLYPPDIVGDTEMSWLICVCILGRLNHVIHSMTIEGKSRALVHLTGDRREGLVSGHHMCFPAISAFQTIIFAHITVDIDVLFISTQVLLVKCIAMC